MSDHHGPDADADRAQSRAPVGEDARRIVACALAEYAGKDPDKPHIDRAGQTLPYPEWRRWLGEAQAAIAAMPPPPEREALREALLQLEYVNKRFPMGSTEGVMAVILAALGEPTP